MFKEINAYKLAAISGLFTFVMAFFVSLYDRTLMLSVSNMVVLDLVVLLILTIGVFRKSVVSAFLLFNYFLFLKLCFPISGQTFGVYLNMLLLFCFFRPLHFHWKRKRLIDKDLYCAE